MNKQTTQDIATKLVLCDIEDIIRILSQVCIHFGTKSDEFVLTRLAQSIGSMQEPSERLPDLLLRYFGSISIAHLNVLTEILAYDHELIMTLVDTDRIRDYRQLATMSGPTPAFNDYLGRKDADKNKK